MYCALEAFVTNNGTTIPSPVDIEQWRSNPPYQLNGCVRVSRVYTDSVGQRMSKVYSEQMSDSICASRIPPDGQESAALLRHAEQNGNGSAASLFGTLDRHQMATLQMRPRPEQSLYGTMQRGGGGHSHAAHAHTATLQRNNDYGTLARMRIQGEQSTFQSTLIRNNLKANQVDPTVPPPMTATTKLITTGEVIQIPQPVTIGGQSAAFAPGSGGIPVASTDCTALLQPVKAASADCGGSTSGCSSS